MFKKTGIIIQCENCGKEVYKTQSQYNKAIHHFCSTKCQMEFQHNECYEDRECEICGRPFHVKKKSTQRFCSRSCQGKWQSTQTGDLNPRSKRIECECDGCGAFIKIMPCENKLFRYHFCSDDCRSIWLKNIYSQSDEVRERSRTTALKELMAGVFAQTTNTAPQRIINTMLEQMDIPYKNEEVFGYYAVDNYLKEVNLVIEVMGDFWHSSPLKYPDINKLVDVQRKRIGKDKAKHTYIKNQYGIDILYLWETDIHKYPDMCALLITEYINNNGVLPNYNSFNYHIENHQLVLNDEIIYPYYETRQVNSVA